MNVLRATCSDATVTTFGAIRTIAQPARRGGDTQVWKVASDGALGPLDLIVNANTGNGANNIQLWHQQIEAALSVQVGLVVARRTPAGLKAVTATRIGYLRGASALRIG